MYPSPASPAAPVTMPAATRVYHQVKRAILEQVHPGGTLLTEAEIAEAAGVSRTPVREALLRLESEGLVALYPKRGALVLPVSSQEVNDVVEARLLVEVHAAGRVWPRRAALAVELAPLLGTMRAAREAGDVPGLMEADRAFHATVVTAAGNRILADLYHRLRDRQMRMGVASLRLEPVRMDHAVHDHAALLALLRDGTDADAQRWTGLVRAHVETAAGHLRGLA